MAETKQPTKRGKKTPAVEDISHEVISSQPLQSLDQRVKNEIARFSLPDARIAELKKNYDGVTIAVQGLAFVKSARAEVRKLRTGIENKRKELKADYLETGRKIDAEAKRLTDLLLEIETPLDNEIKAEEEKKEQERREREEAEQRRINERVNALIDEGMKFNGNYYAIGDSISIDIVTLKNLPDEQFLELVNRVRFANEFLKAQEAQEAEEKRLEEERLEREKREQEAERLRLQAEREQMEKERAEMLQQRYELRAGLLESMGFRGIGGALRYSKEAGEVIVYANDLKDADADRWKEIVEKLTAEVKRINDTQSRMDDEKAQREQLESERQTLLLGMGLKYKFGFFVLEDEGTDILKYAKAKLLSADDQQFSEYVKHIRENVNAFYVTKENEKKEKEEAEKRRLEEAEAARVAAMPEIEKLSAFVRSVMDVKQQMPDFENTEIKTAFWLYYTTIQEAENTVCTFINNFKSK